MRHKTVLIAVATCVAGTAIGLGVGGEVWSTASQQPSTSLPLPVNAALADNTLFVVDSEGGYATRTASGAWLVSLSRPTVLWFYDRPMRGSGTESIAMLTSTWSTMFRGSPPYGALLAPSGPSGHHPTAVKVSTLSFDASSDVANFTVTPDVREASDDTAWLSQLTPSSEHVNGRVVLFVDNGTPPALTASSACKPKAGANCDNAFWEFRTLNGLDLNHISLVGANLGGAQLVGTNLTDANLSSTSFNSANLTNAALTGATIENRTDFSYANLSGVDLSGMNFAGTIYIQNTNFSGANLSNVQFEGSGQYYSNFTNANLSGANFSNAQFENANLTGANVTGTNFSGAQFLFTIMPNGQQCSFNCTP